MSCLHTRVDSDFTYHSPTPGDVAKYTEIRESGREMAHLLITLVPIGRELSTALTKLEECVMHANAGIARAS